MNATSLVLFSSRWSSFAFCCFASIASYCERVNAGFVLKLGLLVYAMYVLIGSLFVSRYFSRKWINNMTGVVETA